MDRLTAAGEQALERGLEVWFSPELWEHSPDQTRWIPDRQDHFQLTR